MSYICHYCSVHSNDVVYSQKPGHIIIISCMECYDKRKGTSGAPMNKPDILPPHPATITKRHGTVGKTKPESDLSDWKVWRDVNKTLGNCACGIKISMCDYHRVVVET